MMKVNKINKLLENKGNAPKKWELDEIIYSDRNTNSKTLIAFLKRIQELTDKKDITVSEKIELKYLIELLEDMDEEECQYLLTLNEKESKQEFIENLARTSAIEVLTNGKINFTTMETACKLSPNDFILCAKRTQDLINVIQSLVIKGETLSKDVAGA
jgi:hypothetical protein